MQSRDAPGWTPLPLMTASTPAKDLAVHTQLIPTPSASAGTGARTRKRLAQEAYDILTEYYNTVTKNPKKQQRIELAERVRRIPGCEDYTPDNVLSYFAGKRQGEKRKAQSRTQAQSSPAQPGASSGHILYPTLVNDPAVLPKLDVLLRETPNPSMVVASIWAGRLGGGVLPRDIMTYADLRRAQELPEDKPRIPSSRSQLPTPESSTSPEPHSTPTSPVVETTWGKVEPADDVKDELESDNEEDELEPEETKYQSGAEHISGPPLHLIAEELNRALFMPPSPAAEPSRPPKTFKDLSQWFKDQEAPTAFLESIGRLHPTARKPPPPVNGNMHT
ncbi:hypothetical protein OH77DRAFT_1524519 [Trametes cingulata]|nr:hypothetical protein OH77DRAFT_1524519 [Trametes cingulata]